MAPEITIRSSLLDRLSDENGAEAERGGAMFTLNEFREHIRRDVEALLNARRRFLRFDPRQEEVAATFLTFGVPDFSNEGFSNKDHRERLRREIERTLARHEPRLWGVVVEPIDAKDRKIDVLNFRVTANIRLEDGPETLVFDTKVEPLDWSVTVEDR